MKLDHTSEWQLVKTFSLLESEARTTLSEARFDAIGAIGNFKPPQRPSSDRRRTISILMCSEENTDVQAFATERYTGPRRQISAY